jgi:toxin ParE1/3/4
MLPEAEDDLVNLYEYVATHDSVAKADMLLDKLEEQCKTLDNNPERGHPVVELSRIYAEGFKEVHFKPYRIIYQITEQRVFIHAVLDGRRELQEFLEERLLRSR